MRLSQSEHKIKQNLEQREIMPSKNLWDNIQQELDKEAKPKKKYIWYRVASIAAVLCLALLAYQGLTTTNSPEDNVVIESDPIITKPDSKEVTPKTKNTIVMQSDNEKTDFEISAVASQEVKQKGNSQDVITTQQHEKPTSTLIAYTEEEPAQVASTSKIKTLPVENNSMTLDLEIDALLAIAEANIEVQSKQKKLEDEVNGLLADVIAQTEDKEQKAILKSISAELLLAEAESELELKKPAKLTDKVWSAIVANFNDIKQDLAFN